MMIRYINILFCLWALLFDAANANSINDGQRRVFEYYAKAALFELCSKTTSNRCSEINSELGRLTPEIYSFENKCKKEVLVIFSINNYYPSVTLRYDKDGLLQIVDRGTWLDNKKEFIEAFLESGNFAE